MNTSQPQLNSLPESDLELLSAYLDNQLGVAERVSLERRLSAEPRLRAELEDLRATAMLLRDLEPVRPPRSFTIDPATAPRRARVFPLAWVMQLGSGLAGMALVLLASVQILVGSPAAAPFPPASSAQRQDTGQATAGAPESSVMMATAGPGEGPVTSAFEQAPAATEAPQPTSAPAAGAPAAEAPAPAAEAAGAAPEEAADQAANSASDATPALPFGSGGSGPAGGMGGPPEIDRTVDAMQGGPAADTQRLPAAAAEPEAATPGVPPGLTLGVGLALLAFAAGTYLYGRRRV